MKKIVCLLLSCIIIFIFSSCGAKASILDMDHYGEAFRVENADLFPNSSCEHMLVYRDASQYLSDQDAKQYHVRVCKYGNCDYEPEFEPHVLLFYVRYPHVGYPTYAENGYLYHDINIACSKCSGVIRLKIFCEKQSIYCGKDEEGRAIYTDCLAADRDWKKVFEDLPYEFEIRG